VAIEDLADAMKSGRLTKPMIQQQLIMHDVDFDPNATRQELAMIVDNPDTKRSIDAPVEEETVIKRLKDYKEVHKELPININTSSSSSSSSSSKDVRLKDRLKRFASSNNLLYSSINLPVKKKKLMS